MKTLKKRFRGLYWRQLFVTAGMVMLTLLLLVFAMQPHVLPGWMDEGDQYDRIWE